jgi:hypothetical protein
MRPKRQNPELYSAAPISTVSAPGLVDDITASSLGVVATTKALKAYPLLARVRVRRCKPDRADLPVALCASTGQQTKVCWATSSRRCRPAA